jgi:hypothetical protein
VKYRKPPFNLAIQFENTLPPKKKNRKETVQLLYMKRLIYLKNGQSLDLLVSPLKVIMSLMISKQKIKEYKDDFVKNNIDSVAMQPV